MRKTASKRRLELFQYGAKAAARYRDGDESLYFCPICSQGYDEGSAISGEGLTLEHIPPDSANGKPLLLTCRDCNSRAGQTIDAAFDNKNRV